MTEEKLKCNTCGKDLSDEVLVHIVCAEPLICTKCGTKHRLRFVTDEPILEPWGWDALDL
jgi:uncharacterized Zn finger protein